MELRRWIRIVVSGAAMIAAFPLLADSVVRCESKGGRSICRADNIGSVMLLRQRSISVCTEGQSWGYTRDAIWVDGGCRADFQVFTPRHDRDRSEDRGRSNRLTCESYGSRQFCAADTRFGVRLARTLGERDCIEGRSWGYGDRGVWVDRGCRAEFVLRSESREERRPQVITCESDHNRRRFCAADGRFGVELKRQLSVTDCVFNQTWGYNRDGIWVSGGCRAEFLIRSR